MRVLVVSEGEHELGGALNALVQRTAGKQFEFEAKTVRDPDLRSHHGKGDGFFKKAVRAMIFAEKQNYEGLIFVVDEDNDPDRRRQIAEAQLYIRVAIPRALGIAVKTFDAWMLADEHALRIVLGHIVQRQPDPEAIRDGKSFCRKLCETHRFEGKLAELYSRIAENAQIAVLEERCPKGFGVFQNEFEDCSCNLQSAASARTDQSPRRNEGNFEAEFEIRNPPFS